MGRDYIINEGDLKLLDDRQTGRPPKAKPAQSNGKKRGAKK
jgi:hypothetical protein